MKILSIGDIHGNDGWMYHTHGGPYEFNNWLNLIENGVPPEDNMMFAEMPYIKYDRIIFVGDYVDSFYIKNVIILDNLKKIITFKSILPDKVVLLWGNHDIQYFMNDKICSGYRGGMRPDLYDIFYKNIKHFKAAHFEKGANSKYLWTHAGVTEGWLSRTKGDVYNERYRHYDIFKDVDPDNIEDLLNTIFETRYPGIFSVDSDSGGIDPWAGPLWVRPKMLNRYPLKGINQIVGHTNQEKITEIDCNGSIHYFIDCMESNGDALVLDI